MVGGGDRAGRALRRAGGGGSYEVARRVDSRRAHPDGLAEQPDPRPLAPGRSRPRQPGDAHPRAPHLFAELTGAATRGNRPQHARPGGGLDLPRRERRTDGPRPRSGAPDRGSSPSPGAGSPLRGGPRDHARVAGQAGRHGDHQREHRRGPAEGYSGGAGPLRPLRRGATAGDDAGAPEPRPRHLRRRRGRDTDRDRGARRTRLRYRGR